MGTRPPEGSRPGRGVAAVAAVVTTQRSARRRLSHGTATIPGMKKLLLLIALVALVALATKKVRSV